MTKGPQRELEAFPRLLSWPPGYIDGPKVGASIRGVKVRTGPFCLKLKILDTAIHDLSVLVLQRTI